MFPPASPRTCARASWRVEGRFETMNAAYYLEDNWSITDNFDAQPRPAHGGLRQQERRRRQLHQDRRHDRAALRLLLGRRRRRPPQGVRQRRPLLPAGGQRHQHQAGRRVPRRAHLLRRSTATRPSTHNGQTYHMPILGPQIGRVDNSQGDGTVGDLRGKVDADMDPVYQDEAILGFQTHARRQVVVGRARHLPQAHNAIDDMDITGNGALRRRRARSASSWPTPARSLTVCGDTNCDGDQGRLGHHRHLARRLGVRTIRRRATSASAAGTSPRRTYQALEFVLDRAWDDHWALNASYTCPRSRGQRRRSGQLGLQLRRRRPHRGVRRSVGEPQRLRLPANDRRHQLKARGTIRDQRPLAGRRHADRAVRPADQRVRRRQSVRHAPSSTASTSAWPTAAWRRPPPSGCTSCVPRGSAAARHGPSTSAPASPTCDRSGASDLSVKFAVYNLLNRAARRSKSTRAADLTIGTELNPTYGQAIGFQTPRYGQFTVSLDF